MIDVQARLSIRDNDRESSIKSNWAADQSGAASLEDFLRVIKRTLIQTSQQVIGEERAKGFPKDALQIVDGKRNKPLSAVNPIGRVEYIARADLGLFALELYDLIEQRSRVDTGQYKRSNWVLYNGDLVASSRVELQSWLTTQREVRRGDTFLFINVMPYARFLERYGIRADSVGIKRVRSKDRKQRSGSYIRGRESEGKFILTANGAYFLAWRAIQRKYRRNTKILFRLIPGGSIKGLQSVPAVDKKGRQLRRTYKRTGRPYLYPGILFIADDQGFV